MGRKDNNECNCKNSIGSVLKRSYNFKTNQAAASSPCRCPSCLHLYFPSDTQVSRERRLYFVSVLYINRRVRARQISDRYAVSKDSSSTSTLSDMLGRTPESTDGLVSTACELPQPKRVGTEPDSKAEVHTEGLQMLRQPETEPISLDQLRLEVKNIYAGLTMVEAKCIDVDERHLGASREQDPAPGAFLRDDQWQSLTALHKQLLHDHHDFFLASQHPSSNHSLMGLAAKYNMPGRL